jgi:hypothetical protein
MRKFSVGIMKTLPHGARRSVVSVSLPSASAERELLEARPSVSLLTKRTLALKSAVSNSRRARPGVVRVTSNSLAFTPLLLTLLKSCISCVRAMPPPEASTWFSQIELVLESIPPMMPPTSR